MRRRLVIVAVCIVAAVAAAVVLLLVLRNGPARHIARAAAHSERPMPDAAQVAVRLLVSAGGRSALAPALASVLPPGRPFPAGTTFTVMPGSWQQAGSYANLTGTLRQPGRPAVRAEIGLVRNGDRWQVTFEATR